MLVLGAVVFPPHRAGPCPPLTCLHTFLPLHVHIHGTQSYRHATGWGLEDMWAGCGPDLQPFSCGTAWTGGAGASASASAPAPAPPTQSSAASSGVAANSPQPQVLGARRQLRREMIDLCFR